MLGWLLDLLAPVPSVPAAPVSASITYYGRPR
jgi:hypothetical protein